MTARSRLFPAVRGRILICLLVMSSLTIASCSRGTSTEGAPGAPGANAGGGRAGGRGGGGGPVPVVTAQSVVKSMPVTIPAVGTAEPLATVQVRAQVTGQLSPVHFSEGQERPEGGHRCSRSTRARSRRRSSRPRRCSPATPRRRRTPSPSRTRYKDLFKRGLIPRDQFETQAANAVRARGDARSRPVAGRERPAEPAVHAHRGADLRSHRRPWRS